MEARGKQGGRRSAGFLLPPESPQVLVLVQPHRDDALSVGDSLGALLEAERANINATGGSRVDDPIGEPAEALLA
jgi:hypothetical protein